MIKDVRDARFLLNKPKIPPEFKITGLEVRTPMVNDQIQRLISALTINKPSWHVPPPRPGDQGQRRASLLEHAANAMWEKLGDDAGVDLHYKFTDGQVSRGEGIIKILLRLDRWDAKPRRGETRQQEDDPATGPVNAEEEEDVDEYLARNTEFKKGARLPIAAKVVARDTYYPFKDEDGLARVMEITERTVEDLYSDFGPDARSAFNRIGLPETENTSYNGKKKLTLIEYWDREWCVYVVADGMRHGGRDGSRTVLRKFRHGYGRPPYFSALGEETSEEDPNFEALPSAYSIIYLAAYLDSIYTQLGNLGYLTGFPTLKTKTDPNAARGLGDLEDTDEEDQEIKIKPAGVINPPPGVEVDVLQFGQNTSSLTGMAGEVRSMMQSAQLPAIMSGIPPGSRTAGYAISELTNAAKAKYQRLVDNGQKTLGEAMNFAFWLIEEKVGEPVYLMHEKADPKTAKKFLDWMELKPEDIGGYYMVRAKIKPRSAVDLIQESSHTANMYAAGAATLREVIEARGVEQPDEVIDERYIEDAMKDPDVQMWAKQRALKKAGMQEQINNIKATAEMFRQQFMATQMGQGGSGPPMGGPPGGGPPGTNGNAPGVISPGDPAVTAPGAPMPQRPEGMPVGPGNAPAPNNMPRLPRLASVPGAAPTIPNRGPSAARNMPGSR